MVKGRGDGGPAKPEGPAFEKGGSPTLLRHDEQDRTWWRIEEIAPRNRIF